MKWKTGWSYESIQYDTILGTLENCTQHSIFWNNLSGKKIRILFSNRYSNFPLHIGAVTIGSLRDSSHAISSHSYLSKSLFPAFYRPVDITPVTVGGKSDFTLGPDQEILSDIISFPAEAGQKLVISLYIPDKTPIMNACSNWAKGNFSVTFTYGNNVESRNFSGMACQNIYPFISAGTIPFDIQTGIKEIQVETDDDVKTLAMFGDSITHMSFYFNSVAKRLYKKYPGKISVINRAIGGNKLLRDFHYEPEEENNGKSYGIAGISRFEKDVFGSLPVDSVCVLEGINDLQHPYEGKRLEELPETDDMIKGYGKLVEISHKYGASLSLATLIPFKSSFFIFGEKGRRVLNETNEWIKSQSISDGTIDFIDQMTDPSDREKMNDRLHLGDGLHPNMSGGIIMGELAVPVIEETLFNN